MNKCIVLFSGGIDSTTALYWALKRYEKVTALTFDYGQRHRIEIQMAEKIAQKTGIPHKILGVNLKQIGGSALTDIHLPLPQYESVDKIMEGLPLTYVPFRNGIFLSMASAWADVEGIKEIVCGFHVIDSPNYPDTRESFVKVMEEAINQGTSFSPEQDRLQIIAPFVKMKKSEIIKEGLSLGADYSYSVSCYAGTENPCRKCSACILRQKAWQEVGKTDHLLLRLEKEGKK
ncbi:MAG: 7-cyano-7-deazaguanine synthase QueC [Candidatus Aminicenantes bacterium]|nr:MAG: 7-cyano-7-deazaguanine synthase QueC [Candidatus Aminicenantes bacterium]